MFGWRARLGVVLPADNRVVEPEAWPHLPRGVSLHAARALLDDSSREAWVACLEANVPRAARELWRARVDAIGFCCQSSCLIVGAEWEDAMARQMATASGVPFYTAGQCMVNALRHLGVSSVAVFSPYPDHLATEIPPYFARHGIEVRHNVNQPSALHHETLVPHPEDAFRRWRAIPREGSGALCILATDQPTLPLIEVLERERCQPVLTSNQVILWALLRAAGLEDELPGPGELFRRRAGASV